MTNFLSFQVHGNADHGGSSVLETVESFLIYFTRLVDKQPLEIFAELLPGISNLQNLHPLFVHFPIAFLLGFFVFDVFGAFAYKAHWRVVASSFLYMGTLAAIATVGAGIVAASTVEHSHEVHDIMERHEDMGFIILGLSCLLSIWRMNVAVLVCDVANSIFMMLSTVLCIVVLLGADLGGLMVYKYGVSVAGVKQAAHDHAHADNDAPQTPSVDTHDHEAEHEHH